MALLKNSFKQSVRGRYFLPHRMDIAFSAFLLFLTILYVALERIFVNITKIAFCIVIYNINGAPCAPRWRRTLFFTAYSAQWLLRGFGFWRSAGHSWYLLGHSFVATGFHFLKTRPLISEWIMLLSMGSTRKLLTSELFA